MAQTRLPADRRREQLLDACRGIVDTDGFGAVTINRIAEECGVTRTVIYQQFGSLNDMLIELVDRELARAAKAFTEAVQGESAPKDFAEAVAGVFAAADADPATWRMFMMPSEGGPPELYAHLDKARASVLGFLTKAIGSTLDDYDAIDTELTARTLHATVDELIRLRLRSPEEYPAQRLLAHAEWVNGALIGAVLSRRQAREGSGV